MERGIPATHEIEYLKDGLVRISFPYFHSKNGKRKYAGFVQLQSYLNLQSKELPQLPFWLLGLLPTLLFILFSQTPFFSRETNSKPSSRFVLGPFILGAILLATGIGLYATKSLTTYNAEYRTLTLDIADSWYSQTQEMKELQNLLELPEELVPDEEGLPLLYIMQRAYTQRHSSIVDPIVDNYAELGDMVIEAIEKSDRRQVQKWLTLSVVGAVIIFVFFSSGYASRSWTVFKKHITAYTYIMPAMIGMTVLVFFPVVYGITLSLTEQNIYNQSSDFLDIWVGFRNYVEILADVDIFIQTEDGVSTNYSSFYWTLFITVMWTVSNVFIGVTLGMLLALILNTPGLKCAYIYRVLLVLPWAIPNYITALTWHGLFHQQFGAINQIVQMFGGQPIAWYDTVFTSFLTGVAANGWLSFPFMMVVGLGALQSVDQEMYDSANLDGATRWQKFRFITFPSIQPVMVPAIILSVIWTFNMFNVVFLVSGGQPAGSNEILITKAFKLAFHQFQYGYAAAYSTIIFLILIIYGVFQNRVSKASEGIQKL